MTFEQAAITVLAVLVGLLTLGFAAHQRSLTMLMAVRSGANLQRLLVGHPVPHQLAGLAERSSFVLLFASSSCQRCHELLTTPGAVPVPPGHEFHVIWRGPKNAAPALRAGAIHSGDRLFRQFDVTETPMLVEVRDGMVVGIATDAKDRAATSEWMDR